MQLRDFHNLSRCFLNEHRRYPKRSSVVRDCPRRRIDPATPTQSRDRERPAECRRRTWRRPIQPVSSWKCRCPAIECSSQRCSDSGSKVVDQRRHLSASKQINRQINNAESLAAGFPPFSPRPSMTSPGWWGWSLRARVPRGARTAPYDENFPPFWARKFTEKKCGVC